MGHHGIEPAHQLRSHLLQPGLRLPCRLCGLRGQCLFRGAEQFFRFRRRLFLHRFALRHSLGDCVRLCGCFRGSLLYGCKGSFGSAAGGFSLFCPGVGLFQLLPRLLTGGFQLCIIVLEGKQSALKGEHPGLIPAHLGACRSQLAAQLLCLRPGAFRLSCGRCLYSDLPGKLSAQGTGLPLCLHHDALPCTPYMEPALTAWAQLPAPL